MKQTDNASYIGGAIGGYIVGAYWLDLCCTEMHCIDGSHSRVPYHHDYSDGLKRIKLTRSEKMICCVRIFILLLMIYLFKLMFENNENAYR